MLRLMPEKRIPLVDSSYRNKYPPLSLMERATYHKWCGDHVQGAKIGFWNKHEVPPLMQGSWDCLCVTTLFSFEWKRTVEATDQAIQATGVQPAHVFVGAPGSVSSRGSGMVRRPLRFISRPRIMTLVPAIYAVRRSESWHPATVSSETSNTLTRSAMATYCWVRGSSMRCSAFKPAGSFSRLNRSPIDYSDNLI